MQKKIIFLSFLVLFGFLCGCESNKNDSEFACTNSGDCNETVNVENFEENAISGDISETPNVAEEETGDSSTSSGDR